MSFSLFIIWNGDLSCKLGMIGTWNWISSFLPVILISSNASEGSKSDLNWVVYLLLSFSGVFYAIVCRKVDWLGYMFNRSLSFFGISISSCSFSCEISRFIICSDRSQSNVRNPSRVTNCPSIIWTGVIILMLLMSAISSSSCCKILIFSDALCLDSSYRCFSSISLSFSISRFFLW